MGSTTNGTPIISHRDIAVADQSPFRLSTWFHDSICAKTIVALETLD